MVSTKRFESGEASHPEAVPLTCGFQQIESPGLYLERRSGALLRVPEDAVVPGRSPVIDVVATEPWIVTKIADDPYLPLTKARMIASNLDLQVGF